MVIFSRLNIALKTCAGKNIVIRLNQFFTFTNLIHANNLMKKIKIIAILAIIIGGSLIAFFSTTETKAKDFGRCTGIANCTACKSCNYCAHCNSGGSCGVCSYSAPAPTPKYTQTKPTPSASKPKTSTSSNNHIAAGQIYHVNTKSLNIRKTPSTDEVISYTLKFGDKVTVLKLIDSKWAQIQFGAVVGYVYFQYLIK
ncbi:MAG: hypothetical protein JWP12_1597 [Bacteroidetes bacterium]|nr:hypothetical protein [Bacteroidota bacterium]